MNTKIRQKLSDLLEILSEKAADKGWIRTEIFLSNLSWWVLNP